MTSCPICGHDEHWAYCPGWSEFCDECSCFHACACSFPTFDNHTDLPDRQQPEIGTFDQWWPASGPDDPPVNMVALGVAHHHATNHDGGGGGDQFSCFGCDFLIEGDAVAHGGWVRFAAEETLPADRGEGS